MTTRGKAAMMSEGIGTMKRLMMPTRMSSSSNATKKNNEPMPSAAGRNLSLAPLAVIASRLRAAYPSPRHSARGLPPRAGHSRSGPRIARDDLGAARARQRDFYHALNLARTIGHHYDTVG